MTSQNIHTTSLTQRYQPVAVVGPYQEPSTQWSPLNATAGPPPIVPARGIKRNTPSDCTHLHDNSSRLIPDGWVNSTSDQVRHPNSNFIHECTLFLRPQNNMNISAEGNVKNNLGNNAHDVNVNRVQSPINRIDLKWNQMPWFHGKISREQAEQLLQPRTDGLFLVRESTNFPGDYTLCVCFQNKVEHYRVKYHDRNLTIDDEEFFEDLEKLIEHYEIDADGLCTKLVKCLPKETNFKSPPMEIVPDSHDNDLFVISENELEICEPIGKGEFGEVMLGKWKKQRVAVKVLKDSSEAEAILMKSLHHENLVNLLGVVRRKDQVLLVTEYMSKGSLVDYLRSRGRLHVTKRDQINFAFDTSAGMEYLERMHVVHRDLAARNVLIAENGIAKVSDFGLARNEKNTSLESAKLPIKWTAPEALKLNKFSNKSDMWSFGILLWEIYSFGRVPYPRIPLADVVKHVEKGYKMEAPEGCPPEVYEIMRQAWDLNPDNRPTFRDVKVKLQTLKQMTAL
ncbi:tyrosine-protein kinase CSK [Photinus pyralis]|uniref:Tyrosine-protein kinase n=1 Tax=Photinus pyralis TaxID=7054 RepID=A0A1Y1LC76_PHOPY|nr:tyrosine-protein kinase CSK [Photinus pyralis]XP_031336021.1 tyrosine-protein kinase CSK [Photinus pyralis]XP_031336022.1 tyrosine-protein kinase CSK [Photinus pyralis]XP_031336023.1 tyrosine-protein kinase CSK [Photinus pyralis]